MADENSPTTACRHCCRQLTFFLCSQFRINTMCYFFQYKCMQKKKYFRVKRKLVDLWSLLKSWFYVRFLFFFYQNLFKFYFSFILVMSEKSAYRRNSINFQEFVTRFWWNQQDMILIKFMRKIPFSHLPCSVTSIPIDCIVT